MHGRLALLLLALPLSGCLSGPGPWEDVEPTPAWKIGDRWNYTLLDDKGRSAGWRLFVVEDRVRVDGVDAYEVSWTAWTAKWYDSATTQSPPFVRTRWFAVEDLNEVWNLCEDPPHFGACKGRLPTWDFPLWEGKTWRYPTAGDVVIDLEAKARREGARWIITTQAVDGATAAETWTYDPAARNMAAYGASRGGQPAGDGLVLAR